jgi:hypothetical protein
MNFRERSLHQLTLNHGDIHLSPEGDEVLVSFEQWTGGRVVSSLGTNSGACVLPFQDWRRFKEAFAPELIARAVDESPIPVRHCADPFGGSGTTALACQFLGIHPITAEVNPFLADLIEAKLSMYDFDQLAADLGAVHRAACKSRRSATRAFAHVPDTFIEPGLHGKWLFDRAVADRIAALLYAIESLPRVRHRRLFRVLLGGTLVEVSNIIVNGKGRRYRKNWEARRRDASAVDHLFFEIAQSAISDAYKFSRRKTISYDLIRGDSRKRLRRLDPIELAIFSPPYPNSFDYTDVYNVELWMLGYLRDSTANQTLRRSTIASHVQISRTFAPPPTGSRALNATLRGLKEVRASLWDNRIPEMIGGYFADLVGVLESLRQPMRTGGTVWMVVGDSRYAGVQIPVAKILSQLAATRGWTVRGLEAFRSMRASAQQGGHHTLAESLLSLRK